ncbi:hypothetical protein [Stenotrophomonas maltophilia]|uniref:hypothetical protein n=1 Tax=Stenotrophomonas maltophilia TaxID=40324 RepID=UPI0013134E09|nr:hypothetical protein [Stenotrophomonas maltophilia]
MAEWTGYPTIIYTNRPLLDLAKDLMACFRDTFGYQMEVDRLGNGLGFLFYRDRDMLDHHLDVGFNVDRAGRGCVGIEVDEVDFYARLSLFEFEGESDFDPYDVGMMLSGVLHVTVVLPAATEENTFCSQVLSDIEKLTKMPVDTSRHERLKEHLSGIKALSAEADRLGGQLDQE